MKNKISYILLFYGLIVIVNINLHIVFKCLYKTTYFTTEIDIYGAKSVTTQNIHIHYKILINSNKKHLLDIKL